MTKAQMQARLDTALDLLTEAADHNRLPKGLRKRFAAFVEETKAMPDNGGSGEQLWRLAEVENPKTGRTVVLHVRKDGGLVPTDRKRIGVKAAGKWTEVRASSRSEARERIAQGQGIRWSRGKNGKIRQVGSDD